MNIINRNNRLIGEISDTTIVIQHEDDVLDLIGNCKYQAIERLIIHESQLHPSFFDLKTKLAGNILQKFSTYQMKIAIVGDFSKYESKSLADFIFESNKQGQVYFLNSTNEAIDYLAK